MGHITRLRIVILIVLISLTAGLVALKPGSKASSKGVPLRDALRRVDGWQSHGELSMDQGILQELDLDDYLNQPYTKEGSQVAVYVGYYLTTKKVGAAHSPLVCFPGQGWLLSAQAEQTIEVLNHKIHAKRMIITKGPMKELVIYWFQAGERTSPGTFLQKLYSLYNRLRDTREDNAFVRISVGLEKRTVQEAVDIARDFIEAFYPRFLIYIMEDGTRS